MRSPPPPPLPRGERLRDGAAGSALLGCGAAPPPKLPARSPGRMRPRLSRRRVSRSQHAPRFVRVVVAAVLLALSGFSPSLHPARPGTAPPLAARRPLRLETSRRLATFGPGSGSKAACHPSSGSCSLMLRHPYGAPFPPHAPRFTITAPPSPPFPPPLDESPASDQPSLDVTAFVPNRILHIVTPHWRVGPPPVRGARADVASARCGCRPPGPEIPGRRAPRPLPISSASCFSSAARAPQPPRDLVAALAASPSAFRFKADGGAELAPDGCHRAPRSASPDRRKKNKKKIGGERDGVDARFGTASMPVDSRPRSLPIGQRGLALGSFSFFFSLFFPRFFPLIPPSPLSPHRSSSPLASTFTQRPHCLPCRVPSAQSVVRHRHSFVPSVERKNDEGGRVGPGRDARRAESRAARRARRAAVPGRAPGRPKTSYASSRAALRPVDDAPFRGCRADRAIAPVPAPLRPQCRAEGAPAPAMATAGDAPLQLPARNGKNESAPAGVCTISSVGVRWDPYPGVTQPPVELGAHEISSARR